MKLSALISALEYIEAEHGDIECYLQGPLLDTPCSPNSAATGMAYEVFITTPEFYTEDDGGWCVNIRNWPY